MKQKKEVLMKNNALIKARYDISVYENKLFILILHKLQKINETTCQCVMKTDEIKSTLNARAVRNKKEISTILSGLRKGAIYFRQENTWGEFGFINGYVYDEESDAFVVQASEKVHGLLRSYMKDGYTPINMQIWLGLRSSYAQRLYDLLRLWSGTKAVINYKVDELKELLMLEEKYPKYAEFKRRVIQPAINELNNTGYFNIELSENKISKKVYSIDFIVNDLDNRIYFNEKESIEEPKKIEIKPELNNIIELPVSQEPKLVTQLETKKEDSKDEFYIPNKKLFTAKTLTNFMDDFKSYDFSDSKNKKALQEAILATLEKDDEEKVKVKAYNYFKITLQDKLNKATDKQNKNIKTDLIMKPKTRFHNINQTFNQYSADDLEKHLFEVQRQKGMQDNEEVVLEQIKF